jgi:ATP-dependent Lon protease
LTDLLLVPLEDTVVFPGMNVTLTVDVGDEDRVVLVPRHENEYAAVGTVAEVTDRVRIRGGMRAVTLDGLHRAVIGAAHTDALGRLRAEVEERPDENPPPVQTRELEREYRAVVEEILDLRGADDRVREFLRAITEAGALADTCAYAPDITFVQRVELLEKVDVVERLKLALELQLERLVELQVRARIRDDVEEGAQKQQREWFLRQQMNSIRKELGEDEGSVVDEYRTKIEDAGMPEDVRAQAERELRRLETMGDASGEASMIRTYLDWLIAVPWSQRSDETLDPQGAREVLDADHAGLEDVKNRIVEYLAVRKLRQDRGIPNDKRSGAILTLIGPPGTGKTSIGESVARALNREFVRMSLGGIRDEAEIRGHRRTYIGSLPGPARPRAARCRDDEPGHPSRRGRQGRRRLARRSVRRPARGARPGAEPLVPRPLPRRRARPLRGLLHRDRERRGHDPRPAARPDGGHPLRRLHGRREDCDRARLPLAAADRAERAARGRGLDLGRHDPAGRLRVHTRGGVRQLERELGTVLRKTATRIAAGQVEAPVEVDVEVVRDALGRQKFFQEAAERTAVPGVATGLAVTGTGGDVLFVEATSMDGATASSSSRASSET